MLGTAASPRPQTSGVRQARGADWVAACVKGGGFVPSSFWKLFIMGGKKKRKNPLESGQQKSGEFHFRGCSRLEGGASGVSGDLLLSFDKETALLNET